MNSSPPTVLTAYPLSTEFKSLLQGTFGADLECHTLGVLRSQGFMNFLRNILSLKGNPLLLVVEHEAGGAFLPILKLIGMVTRASKIYVVSPNVECRPISRWRIILDGLRLIFASLACLWAGFSARVEMRRLLRASLVDVSKVRSNKISILYLKTNLWFGVQIGGSIGHIAGVVNGFLRRGNEVDFVAADAPLMIDDEVRFTRVLPPQPFGMPMEYNSYRFQKVFNHVLVKRRNVAAADIIYQRLSLSNYLGVLVSRKYKVPLIVEYNGSEVWAAKNWGAGMRFAKQAEMAEEVTLKHAHVVVTISEVLTQELIDRGVDRKRIAFYPNCIDPMVFDPSRFTRADVDALRTRHNIPTAGVVVTFVGTFGMWHGVEVLAEAILNLLEQHAEWCVANNVHFMLVGDGIKMPQVRDILGEHLNNGFLTITGLVPQHEAAAYLAASDILASPHVPNPDGSQFFGSPTKLFEYMAMGKAIVASDLDQVGQVLNDSIRPADFANPGEVALEKKTAVLVEPANVQELACGIQFLVENPELRTQLGKVARELALKKYTWSNHVDKILNTARANGIL